MAVQRLAPSSCQVQEEVGSSPPRLFPLSILWSYLVQNCNLHLSSRFIFCLFCGCLIDVVPPSFYWSAYLLYLHSLHSSVCQLAQSFQGVSHLFLGSSSLVPLPLCPWRSNPSSRHLCLILTVCRVSSLHSLPFLLHLAVIIFRRWLKKQNSISELDSHLVFDGGFIFWDSLTGLVTKIQLHTQNCSPLSFTGVCFAPSAITLWLFCHTFATDHI